MCKYRGSDRLRWQQMVAERSVDGPQHTWDTILRLWSHAAGSKIGVA